MTEMIEPQLREDYLGEIFIAEKALESIAYGAILEIKGLRTPDQVSGKGVLNTLSQAIRGKGVDVIKDPQNKLKIKLSLFAEYGTQINDTAQKAIRAVSQKVKELAGLDVDEVVVEITGIVK